MINKKYLKNLRCKEINNKNDFIVDLYNQRIIDSLDIITLDFKKILILGDQGVKIYRYIQKRYCDSQVTICDFNETSYNVNITNRKQTTIDLDLWSPEQNHYDLVISNFFLNISENLEKVINKILKSLLPNGLFLATLPSPENFNFLKSAMIETDIELYGGAYNRFNPTTDMHIIIDILKKNNFRIPLVNYEKIHLEYKQFNKLLHDVRSMNLSYFQKDKKNTFEKKFYFKHLEDNYSKSEDKNFKLTSNFYIVSGWKDHFSQQKPMKPGEAKNKLKDYLK